MEVKLISVVDDPETTTWAIWVIPPPPPEPGGAAQLPSALKKLVVPPPLEGATPCRDEVKAFSAAVACVAVKAVIWLLLFVAANVADAGIEPPLTLITVWLVDDPERSPPAVKPEGKQLAPPLVRQFSAPVVPKNRRYPEAGFPGAEMFC